MVANHLQRRRRAPKRSRRGSAVVEFAIIAPLFFMIVIGCIEMGRALMVQQVLVNASRVGAREAITLSGSSAKATAAANGYATGASVTKTSVNVTPDPASADPGDLITVTVSVNFADVTWNPAPWFMGGVTLDASSVMRKEGFQ